MHIREALCFLQSKYISTEIMQGTVRRRNVHIWKGHGVIAYGDAWLLNFFV